MSALKELDIKMSPGLMVDFSTELTEDRLGVLRRKGLIRKKGSDPRNEMDIRRNHGSNSHKNSLRKQRGCLGPRQEFTK